MEFENVIRERCSIRKFKDKMVSDDVLNKILEAGRLAPSAKNKQPIKILVVKSLDGLNKIDKASPCRYGAPISLVVCGDKDEAFSKGDYSSYEMDASICATHMMLAATNYGVDNIWVLMFDGEVLSREFNLDDNIVPVCIINLGYRVDDSAINPLHNVRKDLSSIVEYV